MKKGILLFLASLFVAFTATAFAVSGKGIELKPGDEVYVCGCGEACPCDTMSMQPGKCSCDKDLVKASVVKVGDEEAVVNVNGKDEKFSTKAVYACACGEACPCQTIAQQPGKCSCGKDMMKVE